MLSVIVTDELLEHLGDYFSSEFVRKCKPLLSRLTFEEYVDAFLNESGFVRQIM